MKEVQPVDSSSSVLRQVDEFFMNTSPVQHTLRNIARRLSHEKIDYVVIGGMALALHGLVRPTLDVDLLMTGEGLKEFQNRLVGRGYVPLFSGAKKHFRDTETGVNVEIITAGEYPGDGKPKPVVFPAPTDVAVTIGEISVVRLESLIELKLASGLSARHRELRDLADVQQLIETLKLPQNFGAKLDGSVRDEYLNLWQLAQKSEEDKARD
ncbi:MAG: hypothetical protein JWM21_1748 [Acidobacteria bacterium]|nr:hypothetical protein [Acidobacteriota bacterium]